VWSITESDIHLEAHIELSDDMKVSQTCQIISAIEQLLHVKHQIDHPTLQFEYGACEDTSFIRK
jgi:cobalt-zinc-cadmium efflux system protein